MSQTTKTPKTHAAVLFLVSLFLLFGLVSGHNLTSGETLWLFGGTIVLGLLVAVGEVEDLLGERFLNFRGFRYACAALTALIFYTSRIQSIGDVNQIFHIDASALPLTVWGGTALHVIKLFFYPFIVAACIAATCLATQFFSSGKERDSITEMANFARFFAIVMSCGLAAAFVHVQLNDDDRRMATFYRIALASDFSGRFQCSGVAQDDMVGLFIGPEQRRIMLARKLDEPTQPHGSTPMLPRSVVPPDFLIVDCIASPAGK